MATRKLPDRSATSPLLSMKNTLLLPLLGVLAAVLVFAWFALGTGPTSTEVDPLEELAPSADSSLPIASDGPALLPDPTPAGDEVPVDRTALEEEGEPERVTVARSPESVPSNAVWVDGRIVFPRALPLDGGKVEITARGRRFGGKRNKRDVRREYTTALKDDQTFRVAFAKETRKGWIAIEGRYLYLPEKHTLNLRDLPDEVVLEPKLGGIVAGTISLPLGHEWSETTLQETRVRIGSWGGGSFFSRTASLLADGSYELTALPPGASYNLSVESEYWCGVEAGDVTVKSGEITTFDAELTLGATVLGQVVDAEGVGRAGVSVELTSDPIEDGWHRQSKPTEPDGQFAFFGIPAGEVKLKAGEKDHLTTEKELGVLHAGERRQEVELLLDEGGFLSGLVQWPDGTPADGAMITVDQERETRGMGFGFGDTRTTRAAADGSFHITGLESSACVVRASSKSYRPQDLERARERKLEGRDPKLKRRGPMFKVKVEEVLPGTSGLLLVLEQGDSVSGRVVDDRGELLTRFLISARPERGGPENLEREDGFNRVVISLDGEFKVDGLRDGTWTISAKATGHARSNEVQVVSPGAQEVELVAPRLAEVHGIVRDASGAPVSGATVWIEDAPEEDEDDYGGGSFGRMGYWGGEATSDEEGLFEAREIAPGRKQIFAGIEGSASSEPLLVDVPPGEEVAGVNCHLREAARITGEVHPSSGSLAEREVSIRGVEGLSHWGNASTDSTGRFEVTDLDPGTYELELEAESIEEGEQDWTFRQALASSERVSVREGERAHVVLGAPPSDPIRLLGTVTSGGSPVANVVVSCEARENREDKGAARTAGDGSWQIVVGEAGQYDFQVGTQSTGRLHFARDVPRQEAVRIDFELPTGEISGVIRDSSGSPASHCQVELEYLGNGDEKKHDHHGRRRSVGTDGEGHYECKHLEGGSYVLRVTPMSSRRWRSSGGGSEQGAVILENLVLAEGEVRDTLDIDLEEGGAVVGTVLGVDGLPVTGASIHVTTEGGRQIASWTSSRSEGQGRFRYEGIAPGRYRVQARQGELVSDLAPVRIYSGSDSEVELVLER